MKTLLIGLGLALATPAMAAACPVVDVGVQEIDLDEATITARYGVAVVAGGDIDLSQCDFPAGYVIERPDFSFNLAGVYGPVEISVDSPGCDSMLLVNAPDGSWHWDDDSGGDLLPLMTVEIAEDGRLDVWVGTFDGSYCDATLVLN